MGLTDFFSSFSVADLLPTTYAEEAVEVADATEEEEVAVEEEEEEEEEPEDTAPGIREECEAAKVCQSFKHHYEECAKRVESGNPQLPGEDCVEELFHLMHCVDTCAAPKIFATLK